MSGEIEKLAIANRGEVAVRIIRACEELAIETVLLHSEADIHSLAYRLSDEQVCIGAAPAPDSYLNIENVINGALSVGADSIHPGFGFLSENADFAEACAKNGLIFVGPSPESIRQFGDKIKAKELVKNIGGPLLPGYDGEDQSIENLLEQCESIGYPVMVKAAAGGGGRGLKVIRQASEAKNLIESAQREGLSAFGSAEVFLEKYLDRAKHIEVQIFGDATGEVFHLYERECSVQRRHQKVIEEAQSPLLSESIKQQMLDAAVQIAREAKYTGAGTVEFLLQDNEFFFLEMNTRLQVEHPVTEMILGVDLVKAQIQVAQGEGVIWTQDEIAPKGHAIECRIYTEDPYKNGMPSTGVIGSCHWPMGPGRRFEVGFESGDEITPYYDSMIAKVIVWDETRARALSRMKATLKETIIFGLRTNIPYLLEILSHPEFVSGEMTTKFIETYFPEGIKQPELSTVEKEVSKQVGDLLKGLSVSSGDQSSAPNPWFGTWSEN